MLRLNNDVLFDVAKALIENDDQEKVYLFGLSGGQPWNALRRAFGSVKIIELHDKYYKIGWDKKLATFEYAGDKPHAKSLLDCIGNTVKELRIDTKDKIYYHVLATILHAKKLTSLTAYRKCSAKDITFFVLSCSSSLTNLKIAPALMTKDLQNQFTTDTLTLLDMDGLDFFPYCCKTSTLVVENIKGYSLWRAFYIRYKFSCDSGYIMSPHLSSITKVIFNENKNSPIFEEDEVSRLREVLPALEHLQFNYENPPKSGANNVTFDWSSILTSAFKVKENMIFNVTVILQPSSVDGFIKEVHENSFKGFKYDGTTPQYHCYSKSKRCAKKSGENLFKILVTK
uniref:Uncharacterized protein n=1 Tax=Panagrolaimus sp. ES5 TaxID=591445 RepID=A0AC34FJV7_9BILA